MRRIDLIVVVLMLAGSAVASPGIEIGVVGQTIWTDNKYLDKSEGLGLFATKSLSKKVSISILYSQIEASGRDVGTMSFGFWYGGQERTTEWVRSDALGKLYEISLHHALVEGDKMRLEGSMGLSVAEFDLSLRGETTGETILVSQSPAGIRLSVDVTVKRFIRSPMGLRMGYTYRTLGPTSYITDALQPFIEVQISSVYLSITARW
jgi:hypothetical protein